MRKRNAAVSKIAVSLLDIVPKRLSNDNVRLAVWRRPSIVGYELGTSEGNGGGALDTDGLFEGEPDISNDGKDDDCRLEGCSVRRMSTV